MFTRLLGILAGGLLIALVALFLFRPAAIFGVSGKALANSVSREVKGSPATCADSGPAAGWRCQIAGEDFSGVVYAVRMKRWGCWSATKVSQPAAAHIPAEAISSCIRITDLFGT
jgi:hypothetical protein